MKTAIGIVLGIWMMAATAQAQSVRTDVAERRISTLNSKTGNKQTIHFSSQSIGFLHTPVHKGFRMVSVGKTSLTLEPIRHKMTLPAFNGILTATPKQLAISSCPVSKDVAIYNCTSVLNDKNIQPAIVDNNKLSNITDEDGGINIDLTQKTSLTFGFGYGGGMSSYKDVAMDMDDDNDDGLVNIGVQFGIK